MKIEEFNGVWYPSAAMPYVETNGGQWKLQRGEMLRHVCAELKNTKCAIDGGAFVGLWAREMAKMFDEVHAFEPVEANYECLTRNFDGNTYNVALADRRTSIRLATKHCNFAQLKPLQSGIKYPVATIDSLGLDPDFIKLDVEGCEVMALEGAKKTIARCGPVMCVEHKLGREKIAEWMADAHYVESYSHDIDTIWVPRA